MINGMPVGNGECGARPVEAAMGELGLEGCCYATARWTTAGAWRWWASGERTFITVSGCESQWNENAVGDAAL
ncbi:hypothetical protein M8494_27675 [Serratia ureilytica]